MYLYIQATSESDLILFALITPWKPKTLLEIMKDWYFCKQYLLGELAVEKNDKAQDPAGRALLKQNGACDGTYNVLVSSCYLYA